MRLKIVLPILVILVAVAGAVLLLATRETVEPNPPQRRLPAVPTSVVLPQTVELSVRSQGTVMPRTESQLIAEVAGSVVWTSPSLASGGYFTRGQTLVRLDSTRYKTAVERARARLERSEGEFEYASATLRRQEQLASDQIVSANRLEDAHRAARTTDADLRDARAALEEAELDLKLTEIQAPFRGRVRDETVDVGQYLSRGTSFATLYATDYAEVRLPISDDQLAFFEVPVWTEGAQRVEGPEVRLFTEFAGGERSWLGKIVRTEGEIDPRTRMVHVIARVENASPEAESGALQIPVGLFVQAEIAARTVDGVFVVPRASIWNGDKVVIVDSEDRLRVRAAEILRIDKDEAFITTGLESGDRICVAPPANLIDGQEVAPYEIGGQSSIDENSQELPDRSETPS